MVIDMSVKPEPLEPEEARDLDRLTERTDSIHIVLANMIMGSLFLHPLKKIRYITEALLLARKAGVDLRGIDIDEVRRIHILAVSLLYKAVGEQPSVIRLHLPFYEDDAVEWLSWAPHHGYFHVFDGPRKDRINELKNLYLKASPEERGELGPRIVYNILWNGVSSVDYQYLINRFIYEYYPKVLDWATRIINYTSEYYLSTIKPHREVE